MTLYPNVKLNLGLRVLGKRSDGFHELETLFVPYYGWKDELTIVPSERFSIAIEGPSYTGWNPSADLCAKAWKLLEAEFGIDSVAIHLFKNSPVGAGLGGGSADAAFALMALNDIFSLGLDKAGLAERAAMLGSDCAFFIYNRPMLARGRGEVLEAFDLDLSSYRIIVEVPREITVSTREAYAGVDAALSGEAHAGTSLPEILSLPPEQWRGCLVNDFEPSVFALHPEIASLKEKMYAEGALYAAMSGSGSAVFGIFAK
ncbi:MAG: 4-(cytidine 5'-diphospho)-2-C-methyl-D-erythritol kinase [Bacteroidales bacterium]|nr:4-(cytidine 5'-diphospho)-2-C-methyl-D-erythritol kinase [Bacteroidales bacterium]